MALLLKKVNGAKVIAHFCKFYTALSNSRNCINECPNYMHFNAEWNLKHAEKASVLMNDLVVHDNFLSETEEQHLFVELEAYLKNLHYEFDHWDDAIHGYRETERLHWNPENTKTIDRVRTIAFPASVAQLKYVHVLDLAPKGYIKPHVDAVRFCGNTIAGLCLLSDCVMRLVHNEHKSLAVDVFLKQKSLYIMRDSARYEYTHEVLSDENSYFKNKKVPRNRRISVICRNEPS